MSPQAQVALDLFRSLRAALVVEGLSPSLIQWGPWWEALEYEV